MLQGRKRVLLEIKASVGVGEGLKGVDAALGAANHRLDIEGVVLRVALRGRDGGGGIFCRLLLMEATARVELITGATPTLRAAVEGVRAASGALLGRLGLSLPLAILLAAQLQQATKPLGGLRVGLHVLGN